MEGSGKGGSGVLPGASGTGACVAWRAVCRHLRIGQGAQPVLYQGDFAANEGFISEGLGQCGNALAEGQQVQGPALRGPGRMQLLELRAQPIAKEGEQVGRIGLERMRSLAQPCP